MTIKLIAHAKVNMTLEVLGERSDGYHEITSVMQTISLNDEVSIERADSLTVEMTFPAGGDSRTAAAPPPWGLEKDLAFRAARALWGAAGGPSSGARIRIDKGVPVAAGLGGGSSDAAAVLRGLNRLWERNLDDATLAKIGATLGSDVPFFVYGGTALVTGRGEIVQPLPDVAAMPIGFCLIDSVLSEKTAGAYGLLSPELDYSSGERTRRLAKDIHEGYRYGFEDFFNAFSRPVSESNQLVAELLTRIGGLGFAAQVCGAGPSVVFAPAEAVLDFSSAIWERTDARLLAQLRRVASFPEVQTIGREAATRLHEV